MCSRPRSTVRWYCSRVVFDPVSAPAVFRSPAYLGPGQGPGEPLGDLVDAGGGLGVAGPVAGRVVVEVDVRQDEDAVLQVVEDDQRVGEHQQGLGQAVGVGRGLGQALEVGGGVVGDVADGPAVEAGDALDGHGPVARKLALDDFERVHRAVVFDGDAAVGSPTIRGSQTGARAEHLPRLRPDEAVAGDVLAPLDAFEEEGVAPAGDLEEGGDRRLHVGEYLAVDGDEVALAPHGADLLQRRVVHH